MQGRGTKEHYNQQVLHANHVLKNQPASVAKIIILKNLLCVYL